MAEAIRKSLDDFIECSICAYVYKDPRTLPCLHTFCLVCCEGFCRDKSSGDEVECPMCREPFVIPPSGVSGLRKNFNIEALKQLNNSSISHQGNTDLQGLTKSAPKCNKHTNRTLDWYCVECKEAACATCRTNFHASHNVEDVEDVATDLRATLTSGVIALSEMYKNCDLCINKTDDEEKKFMKNIQRVEAEIKKEAKRLQELIERHKSELLAEVSARKRDRLKELENSKYELRQQMAFVSSLMSYTTELVKNGPVGEIAVEANSLGIRTSKLLEAQKSNTNDRNKQFDSYRLRFAPRKEKVIAIGHLTESTPEINVTLAHSFPEEHLSIAGLTTLDEQLYVICKAPHIVAYNSDTFDLLCELSVPGLTGAIDMTSCRHYRCLYIANRPGKVVHRVEVKTTDTDDKFTKWNVDDEPWSLSVNADHNVIVTCFNVNKITVFTTFGQLQTVIDLRDVVNLLHVIQLTPDKFVVCHGGCRDGENEPVHRVCIVDGNGNVQQSFGSNPGSNENHVRGSERLAVVNGFIFVAARNSRRVLMLSPTLRYIQTVVSKLSGYPTRMCFDEQNGRLYLGESKWENGKWTTGHINVYSVTSKQPED